MRRARKRVARLMRAAGLVGCRRRRRARTTAADPAHAHAPNLVARDFAAPAPDRPWLGAIAYVATREGRPFLAVLVDAHSRGVVGRAMAEHLRTDLALDALTMALRARRPPAGLDHHTDRGCRPTAAAYREALIAPGIARSLRRAGDGYDHATAERCFATLKAELIDARTWPTRAAARTAILARREVWHKRQRRHSAVNYRPPATFEEHVLLSRVAAWR